MISDVNIASAFCAQAHKTPDRMAMIASDLSLNYDQLRQVACCFARKMREHGVDRGSVVALDTRDMVVSLGSMFATALLGARFLSFETELLRAGVVVPTHIFKSPEQPARGGVSHIDMDASWSPTVAPTPDPGEPSFEGFSSPDDPWWIINTSGTTGDPKYMELSQRIVIDRSKAAKGDFIAGETVFCSLFICTARPFYVRAQAALLNGCPIVDTIDVGFMRQNGVTLVAGSPTIVKRWLNGRVLLPKFKQLQVSGSRLDDEDAMAFLESFETVEDVYGSSETNKSFVNTKRIEDGDLITIGKPTDSDVQIVDQAFALCPPRKSGTVRVRNGYMVHGYLKNQQASEHAFQGGWFYPGDFASWGERGALRISGRVDELINIGGVKIDPKRVDNAMMSVAGVLIAACFQNPRPEHRDQLLSFVTVDPSYPQEETVRAAHAAVVAQVGPVSAPAFIIATDDIPLTYDGVPRRNECQRRYLGLPQPGNS